MKKTCILLLVALALAMLVPQTMASTLMSPRYARYRDGGAWTAPAQPAPQAGVQSQSAAEQLVAQVNAERAKAGLSTLRVDAELTRAAQVRAVEITQVFSHTRPDGTSWSTVSARAYGENLAMGQRTVDKVMAAWLTSKGHRENLLRPGYGSIGVCCYVYGGVTYWVQLFGK